MPRTKKGVAKSVSTSAKKGQEITFEGQVDDTSKISTGLFSFDLALGGGLPTNRITEVYGWYGSAKSTLVLYLSGKILAGVKGGRILELETENGFDPSYARMAISPSGFSGKVYFTPYYSVVKGKKEAIPDDLRADTTLGEFAKYEPSVAVLDSVGGIIPVKEVEGDVSDALMGLRARLMAKFMRKSSYLMRVKPEPSHAFVVNHMHAIIGGRGVTTIGGDTIKFLASTRVRLSTDEKEDGSMIVRGHLDKVRYRLGSFGLDWQCYFLAGYGIHVGLSAVVDCLGFQLAKKDNGVVSVGSKSFGRFSKMLEKYDDDDLFKTFHDVLKREIKV